MRILHIIWTLIFCIPESCTSNSSSRAGDGRGVEAGQPCHNNQACNTKLRGEGDGSSASAQGQYVAVTWCPETDPMLELEADQQRMRFLVDTGGHTFDSENCRGTRGPHKWTSR
ncbi:hypothetical protein GN956_G25678 [Arapaima gigas]